MLANRRSLPIPRRSFAGTAFLLLFGLWSSSVLAQGNFNATPNPNQGNYDLSFDTPTQRDWVEERFNGGSWVSLGQDLPSPQSFANKPAGAYEYRMKYIDRVCTGGGRGGCTTTTEYTTSYAVTVTLPEIITQTISLDGTYDVSWPAVSGASTYTLQERQGAGAWAQVSTGSQTSWSTSRVTGDYEYRVKACAPSEGCSYSSAAKMSVELVSHLQSEPGIQSTTSAGSGAMEASVNAAGDAAISIPIRVPRGVNGMAPQLNLKYSSGASSALFEDKKTEGVLGYGWDITDIPEIRRCRVGLDNLPVQYDSTDRLCLDGIALVQVGGSSYWADNAEYRTEIQSFAKINARGTSLPNRYFEVAGPDGSSALFGSTNESRLAAPGESDPYLWSIKSQTDAFGNQISYTWHELSSIGTNYLRFIDFGGSQIAFEYEERCKSVSQCDIAEVQSDETVPGIRVRAVVLNEVKTKADGKLVAGYRLDNNYDSNGYLRLEKVQHCGYDESGGGETCMAPTTFAWDTLLITDTATSTTANLPVVDEVTDGFGDKSSFGYAVIDGSGASAHALHVSRPGEFPDNALPSNVSTSTRQRAVVQYLYQPDGNGGTTTAEFKYHDYPLYDNSGRGYIGFPISYVEFHDKPQYVPATQANFDAHIRTYTQFRLDFPYIGFVGRQFSDVQTDPNNSLVWRRLNKSLNRYTDYTSHSASVHFPHLQFSLVEDRELRADGSEGYGSAAKTTVGYCWRTLAGTTCPGSGTTHEYPTQATTLAQTGLNLVGTDNDDGVWGNVGTGVSVSGMTNTRSNEIDLDNVSASWLLAFPFRTEKGWGATAVTESVEVDYARDATTHNKPGVIQYFDGDPEFDRTISLTYDAAGNVTNVNDTGIDQVTSSSSVASFATSRYPQTVTNAAGQSSSLGYDLRFGTVDSITDPNSDVTTTTRDPFGRVTSSVSPDGTTRSTTYAGCSSGCSAVTWATPRLKVSTNYTNNGTQVAPTEVAYFDTRGLMVLREVQAFSTSDGWVREQRHYDRSRRLVKQSLPYFSVGGIPRFQETYYDHEGRVARTASANGESIEYNIYADVGTGGHVNIEVTETGENRTKRYRYNRLGQLADTTDAFGTASAVTTAYTYTVRGELETVTVDGTEVANITYDDAGNRRIFSEPNTGLTILTYYSNSLLKQSTDANSNKTLFEYDELKRLEKRTDGYLGGSPVVNTWTWDTALNGKGRLANRSNGSQFTETYAYDSSGRLDTVTADINVPGFNDNSNYVTDFGYDSAGRLSTIAYPNLSVTNVYTSLGYLEQVKKGAVVLHQYTDIDAFGNITGETYGSGLKTARDYDAETGELTAIRTGTTALPTSIQDIVYQWQTDGALLKRTDKQGTTSTSDDLIETFSYDDIGRLTNAGTALTGRDLSFTYDDLGNLLSKLSDQSGDLDVTSYSYPMSTKPHRLTSITIAGVSNTLNYDSAGNITEYTATSGDDTFLDYDDAGRVLKITIGSTRTTATPTARDEFWYGPDGQRFLRKATWDDSSTQKTSWTLYLQGGVFEESHPTHDSSVDYRQRVLVTANVLHRYIKTPSSSSTSIEYLHRDHLGSVTATTNSSAAMIRATDFDPFGRQRSTGWSRDVSTTELDTLADDEEVYQGRGFTDHEMLNRTGFVHMNGRVYDHRIGRFVQPDPVIGQPTASQNYNRYAYLFNSPMSATDPTGLQCDDGRVCVTFGISVSYFSYLNLVNPNEKRYGGGGGGRAPNGPSIPEVLERILDFYSCQVRGLCKSSSGGFGGFGRQSGRLFGTGFCGEGFSSICMSLDAEGSDDEGRVNQSGLGHISVDLERRHDSVRERVHDYVSVSSIVLIPLSQEDLNTILEFELMQTRFESQGDYVDDHIFADTFILGERLASHYYNVEGFGVVKGSDLNYISVGMMAAHYDQPLISVPTQNVMWNGLHALRYLFRGNISRAKYEVDQMVRGSAAFWQGYGYEYYKQN